MNRLYSPALGKGAQGEVRKALHFKTGEIRAIKMILKEGIGIENIDQVQMEIAILKEMDHPNVVKIFEFFESKLYFHISMEMCKGQRLFNQIIDMGGVSERRTADIIQQLLSALKYLHAKGVVHRDIKSENMIYDGRRVKIIDFGTSRHYDPLKHMGELKGTVYYVAPEVISKKYTEKCDIWSTGILLFILLTGTPPFVGDRDKEIFRNILNENYSLDIDGEDDLSDEVKDMVHLMLTFDQDERPSAEELLTHPWFEILNKDLDDSKKEQNKAQLRRPLANLELFDLKNRLQEGVFYYFVSHMVNKKEKSRLAKSFRMLDKNNDGELSRAELLEGFQRVGRVYSKEEVNEIFDLVDTDGSGTISFTEYMAAAINKEQLLANERLEKVFRIFDRDKSGTISLEEFQFVFHGKHYIPEEELVQLIEEADMNEDGELDFEEFKHVMDKMIVKAGPNLNFPNS